MVNLMGATKCVRFGLCVLLLGLATETSWAASELPAASNVMQRFIARAEVIAGAKQTNHYTYLKRAVSAELDANDRVSKSTERIYNVTLIGGLPFSRLVKIQGRDLSPQELEKENEREMSFRRKVTHVDMNKKAARREALVTKELIDRFEFTVTKREMVHDRPALAIKFSPKPNAPEKTIEERIYKEIAGTLWIDEEEFELVKLDAHLRSAIPLGWFGAIGSLNKFNAMLERIRLADGVWVNRQSSFQIVARKLLSAVRMKITEESSDFRREQGAHSN
jgi:hypothetical protein